MSILKSSSKSKDVDGKMVGVIFPKKLHSYFSLFALTKGLTKSIIVKQEMEKWLTTMPSENVLLEELILKIKNEWELVKGNMSLSSFKRELKRELKQKGACEEHIKIILKIYDSD
jgi:hypothetical protein